MEKIKKEDNNKVADSLQAARFPNYEDHPLTKTNKKDLTLWFTSGLEVAMIRGIEHPMSNSVRVSSFIK